MRKIILHPTAKDVAQMALDDSVALLEYLRARVESERFEAYGLSSAPTWTDAATAQQLARDLLHLAARRHYTANASEEAIRDSVLAEARERFARSEERDKQPR